MPHSCLPTCVDADFVGHGEPDHLVAVVEDDEVARHRQPHHVVGVPVVVLTLLVVDRLVVGVAVRHVVDAVRAS